MCLHTRRTRSDLIVTYKIINGIPVYNVKTYLFLDFDQSGKWGHCKNYLKGDLDWISENLHFSNRTVDRWNSLSECYVTCNSINCFKFHISSKLEPETTWSVDILENGLYVALSLCPLSRQCHASVLVAFGKFGNFVCLMCSHKLTGSQISLPYGIKQKIFNEKWTENKPMSMISSVH